MHTDTNSHTHSHTHTHTPTATRTATRIQTPTATRIAPHKGAAWRTSSQPRRQHAPGAELLQQTPPEHRSASEPHQHAGRRPSAGERALRVHVPGPGAAAARRCTHVLHGPEALPKPRPRRARLQPSRCRRRQRNALPLRHLAPRCHASPCPSDHPRRLSRLGIPHSGSPDPSPQRQRPACHNLSPHLTPRR